MKTAEWIWINDAAATDEYAVFCEEINYTDGAVIADISCAGDYAIYINQNLAAFGQYADYAHYKVADSVEITQYLRKGPNSVRIIAWYQGISSSTYLNIGKGIIYEFSNGGKLLACSKSGVTKCGLCQDYVSYRNLPITIQLGLSYEYDTRYAGMYTISGTAVKVSGFDNLRARPVAKLVTMPTSHAKLINKDKMLYDLGEEKSGILHIKFCADSGAKVKVAYGEHITDGEVRHYIDGRDFSVSLIACGKTAEFCGVFRRLGGRYLQVFCDSEVEIDFIGVKETLYPLAKRPFKAETADQQRIYDVSVRTLELCMHEHYEDTPWREQAMYIMDSRNQMLCGYYAFDNHEFAKAAIRLMLQGQQDNGLYDLCFPAKVPITIPSFSLMLTTVVKEYYDYTKDMSIVSESYSGLVKMFGFFDKRRVDSGLFKTVTEDGIWHFYEWAGDLDGAFFSPDSSEKIRNEFDSIINAFLSLSLLRMSGLAQLLGLDEDVKRYHEEHTKINELIREMFFVKERGLFKTYASRDGYSQLANALCVLCGAATGEVAAAIADKLAYGYDDWVHNTLSMDIFRYDAMLAVNRDKFSSAIVDEINKTYRFMLDKGATSFWETIKGEADFHGAGSLCHGWSATPVYYYNVLREQRG